MMKNQRKHNFDLRAESIQIGCHETQTIPAVRTEKRRLIILQPMRD
jgi:hypothetical protein